MKPDSPESIADILKEHFQCSAEKATAVEELITAFQKTSETVATTTAQQLTLPNTPPKYPYAPRMEGGIVKYLEDNWAPYIKAGALTRPDLSRIDPKAYQALRNWLSLPENQLPEHLHVPTKTEALDREIASLGGEDRLRRLSAALASRERRRSPS